MNAKVGGIPELLCHLAFTLTAPESSGCSTSSFTLCVVNLFHVRHPDRCIAVAHCVFILSFSNG